MSGAGQELDLLFELGVEELPAQWVLPLWAALDEGVRQGLEKRGFEGLDAAAERAAALSFGGVRPDGLPSGGGDPRVWATPRRLAIGYAGVPAAVGGSERLVKGPRVEGAKEAAVQGFAARHGVEPSQLEVVKDPKGDCYAHREKGAEISAAQAFAQALEETLDDLAKGRRAPGPRMVWDSGVAPFVRPVRWMLALAGGQQVQVRSFGLTAAGETRGHRRWGAPQLPVGGLADYFAVLAEAGVEPSRILRRAVLERLCESLLQRQGRASQQLQVQPRPRRKWLDEVVDLCEWPSLYLCQIDDEYAGLPAELVGEILLKHQRCLPLVSGEASTGHFLAVADGERGETGVREPVVATLAPGLRSRELLCQGKPAAEASAEDAAAAQVAWGIRRGFERVVRPRLADGKFFLDEDAKIGLEGYAQRMDRIALHALGGSLADQAQRLHQDWLPLLHPALGLGAFDPQGPLARAALWMQADQASLVVQELPELQGWYGAHMARQGGAEPQVAAAMDPGCGWDAGVPQRLGEGMLAQNLVRLAHRLDSLFVYLALGETATSSRDPYGLRRLARDIGGILLYCGLDWDLVAQVREGGALREAMQAADRRLQGQSEAWKKRRAEAGWDPEDLAQQIARVAFEPLEQRFRRYLEWPAVVRRERRGKGGDLYLECNLPSQLTRLIFLRVCAQNSEHRAMLQSATQAAKRCARLAWPRNSKVQGLPQPLPQLREGHRDPDAQAVLQGLELMQEAVAAAFPDPPAQGAPAWLAQVLLPQLDPDAGLQRGLHEAIAAPRDEFLQPRGGMEKLLAALDSLAALDRPLEAYLDRVRIMDGEPSQVQSRLDLLATVAAQAERIADFRDLPVDGTEKPQQA